MLKNQTNGMAENYFGITDTGKLRDNNEDAFIAQPVLNNKFIAACVIDGVGGYEGGEVAAALAQESILTSFKNTTADIIKLLKQSLSFANEKIYKERIRSEQNNNMACVVTLALVDAVNNKFYYAHVGDTRLYLLRDDTLVKVTKDQSFVGFLEDTGRLSEADAMAHPKRNEINKALGFDEQIVVQSDYIETGESPFLPGDILLLCSDGLTDMVSSGTITSILISATSLEEKGKKLIAAANTAGGKDNITVVLVQNTKKPVKQKATKPVLVKKTEASTNEISATPLPDAFSKVPVQKRKGGKGLIAVLSILCIIFLGGFLWMVWNQYKHQPAINLYKKPIRNEAEKKLQDSINNTFGNTLFLTDSVFGKTILLTDTLWIKRDSLHLSGNGITLLKDSAFASGGAAIVLAPECKYIVIDSVIMQNFSVAILAGNYKSLQIRRTQFKNCAIAIGYQFTKDSVPVSGYFIKEKETHNDSLSQKISNQAWR